MEHPSRAAVSGPPPGPRMPALVQAALFYRDPPRFFEGCRRRFGEVFCVRLPGAPPIAYVASPDLAREVFSHDRDVNRAGDARRPYLAPLVGEDSILCLEGDAWRRQRQLVAPPFHGERVARWRHEIAAIAAAEIDGWPSGESLALRPRMQAITLEVILRLVFGVRDADPLDRLRELLPSLVEAVDSYVFGLPNLRTVLERPVLRRVPGNPVRRFLKVRKQVDDLLYEEIARRREELADGEDRGDVLSMMLSARDENEAAMSDRELRDELVTLLEAGHETTATALSWAFERLARAPAACDRLVGELNEGQGGYLNAVIKEVLRSRPVVIDAPRELAESLELGGYHVPAGWLVAPAIPLVHRSRSAFADAERFRPERFLEDDPPTRGWIPFGGGQRRCLGSRLALLEMKTVIPEVLSRFAVRPVDLAPERQRVQHVTLSPSAGARVIAEARG